MEREQSRITRDHIPGGAYREDLMVRSYEVGRDGRAHPATLLRYLEHLATRASAAVGYDSAWYERQGQAWVVREMLLLLGEPPRMDDVLGMATWVSDFRRVQAYRECAVWYGGSGRRAARARGRWGYIDRQSLQPTRVPESIIADCPTFPISMEARRLPAISSQGADERLVGERTIEFTARRYEADSQLHINNCVYVDWLEEAIEAALGSEALAIRWPRYCHIEYLRPLWPGDRVRLTTRWIWQSRRRLLVEQEIAAAGDGALAVRARSEHLRRVEMIPS